MFFPVFKWDEFGFVAKYVGTQGDMMGPHISIIYIYNIHDMYTLQYCPLKPFFIMGQDTSDRCVLLLQCDEPQLQAKSNGQLMSPYQENI